MTVSRIEDTTSNDRTKTMTFKTTYFKTEQQAIAYFNKAVSREQIAYMLLDRENNKYLITNEKDFTFFAYQNGICICLSNNVKNKSKKL